MLFRVDTTSSEPIFEQLAHQIRIAILQGNLAAGDRLPPAREVAGALDVNLHTVLHAYQMLRDEGQIELRRGRGALVSNQAQAVPREVTEAVAALVTQAHQAHLAPHIVVSLVKEALA
ncbi:GntR family transcriptional regulator [Jonesia quinghaiensis]|uniref:GntR family transcriptional regulator n=1 Tax=Jonesia quinghaiensis TaxID=262806 RepID=UPI0003FFC55D|nr:GntR family transcriptional regulator [Jonesia quinghaiensis]